MLGRLLELLDHGPFETQVAVHGPNTQLRLTLKIHGADQVGIVGQPKGMMGGYSETKLYPWSAISWIAVPA